MSNINLGGLGGILAALIALFLYGRSLGKQSAKKETQKALNEAENQKTEKEIGQASAQAAVENAQSQAEALSRYESNMRAIDDARRVGDPDALSRIASETVKKAIEMGAQEIR